MSNKNINHFIRIISVSFLFFSACKKMVDVDAPSNQIVSPLPFGSDDIAASTVTGMYSEMMGDYQGFASSGLTLYAGLCADELYYYTPGFHDNFSNNNILPSDHGFITSTFWTPAYKYIYTASLCIEQINASASISKGVKNQLLGECKFIRAFCYFQLVNLFGDVPMITGSDYKINALLPQSDSTAVYGQMISDLVDANQILPETYTGIEKARPNKWAAAALLSRIYLFTHNWAKAEVLSSAVIGAGNYTLETDLDKVFLKNSTEAILQFQPVFGGYNTWEGFWILPGTPDATPTYLLKSSLLNAFDSMDRRKKSWIATRSYLGTDISYPYKYKVHDGADLTEYYMILRLAEQYLIRAEARAQQNSLANALSDLNAIRNRAGLTAIQTTNQNTLLLTIENERRLELFAEWGHRWFDLKRSGRVNAVLSLEKPTTWKPTAARWPIPISQINANPSLKQNPGY